MRISAILLVTALLTTPPELVAHGRTHTVIVVGLGGEERYRQSFHEEASQVYTALIERHGLPVDNITYLGERVDLAPDMISMRSTRANVLEVLGQIAGTADPLDRLFVVLIGHGTIGREEPQFNLPGPDLLPSDIQEALTAFPTQTLALVHTGSASGGFIAPLSGPNRILVAATRNERQLNATEFGQFFAAAIAGEDADLDKDERVSLLEAFLFTRREVERLYENQNELLTENAVLDDNGDGSPSHDAGLTGADGPLAATFQLGGISGTAGQVPDDPELARLYRERNEIQALIDGVRARRSTMTEDEYLDAVEPFLIELALKNREIRALEGAPR